MTRPQFSANSDGWELRSAAGLLEWISGLRDRPKAVFHHSRPRWYDDQPLDCPALGYVCYPDAGTLRGHYLAAFVSNDPRLIEQAMRAMWDADHFDREVGAA